MVLAIIFILITIACSLKRLGHYFYPYYHCLQGARRPIDFNLKEGPHQTRKQVGTSHVRTLLWRPRNHLRCFNQGRWTHNHASLEDRTLAESFAPRVPDHHAINVSAHCWLSCLLLIVTNMKNLSPCLVGRILEFGIM